MADPQAAVAIVHALEPEESVLLIRRAEREGDPWSGQWSFPGGRRDPQDHSLLDTALRELQEECGIRLAPEQMEAAWPPRQAGRRVGHFLLVAPFLFRVTRPAATVLDPVEASEALWLPLRIFRDPTLHGLRSVRGLPLEMRFPSIELHGVPLWGFTYRLISDWLGLSPEPGDTIVTVTVNPYAVQLGNRNAREVIAETPGQLAALVERLGPDGLERSLAPGKWPARAILCHLADTELAFSFRLRQSLAEPHHVIQPFDQDAWATPYSSLEARGALEAFSAARRWNLALLQTVQPAHFSKKLTHPERGEMTFQTLVETMAGHDLNHVRQLETIASRRP